MNANIEALKVNFQTCRDEVRLKGSALEKAQKEYNTALKVALNAQTSLCSAFSESVGGLDVLFSEPVNTHEVFEMEVKKAKRDILSLEIMAGDPPKPLCGLPRKVQ